MKKIQIIILVAIIFILGCCFSSLGSSIIVYLNNDTSTATDTEFGTTNDMANVETTTNNTSDPDTSQQSAPLPTPISQSSNSTPEPTTNEPIAVTTTAPVPATTSTTATTTASAPVSTSTTATAPVPAAQPSAPLPTPTTTTTTTAAPAPAQTKASTPSSTDFVSSLKPGCWKDPDSPNIYKIRNSGKPCFVKNKTQYTNICGTPMTAHSKANSLKAIIGSMKQDQVPLC